MLHLFYGTRKAREAIYDRMAQDVAAKRRAYLIVPDQKVLLAETALYARLPGEAALYTDAVGFSRLANLVCRKYGGLTYTYATEGARLITVYRALHTLSPKLRVYGGKSTAGTYSALASLFAEFRACRVTPQALSDAAEALPDTPLGNKLSDLSLLFELYGSLLHERFAEPADDVDTLAALLRTHDFFGDAHVYIDAFVSFTGQEFAVLSEMLSRGTDVTVTLPFRFANGTHTAECADTRKRLLALCARLGVSMDETDCGEADVPPALAYAKENLWDFSASAAYDGGNTEGVLEIVKCADRSEEAALCLREIRRALDEGYTYADIAVVARDAESYIGRLDRTLERSAIPFFLSGKREADAFPLFGLLRAVLALYVYDFRADDVQDAVKTGLCGLTDEESDLFCEYVDRWRVNGKARYLDGEDFTMSTGGYTAPEDGTLPLAAVNAVKHKWTAPLSRLCDTLSGAVTVRDFAGAIYTYLVESGVREASVEPERTRYFGVTRTADAIRLWNLTVQALDTLVDAAGDEQVTAAEFSELLSLLFSTVDIAKIPGAVDQVLIGSADTVRMDSRPIVILVGAVDGVFPAPVSESPTLGETEREKLRTLGVELSQGLSLRAAREFYHFWRVLDAAEKRAVLSTYAFDERGRPTEPSFGIARLQNLFTDPESKKCALCTYTFSDLPFADRLPTAAEAAETVGGNDEEQALLSAVLAQTGAYVPPIVDAAALGNVSAALSGEAAGALFGERMSLSQSKLDRFSDCPLAYYLQYGLHLADTRPFRFDLADTGTFVHGILERFIDESAKNGRALGSYTHEELQKITRTLCAEAAEKVLAGNGGGRARLICFFERLSENVGLILEELNDEFAESDFTPLLAEYPIGRRDGHAPLTVRLPDGGEVTLNGVIDRVDIYKKDGKVYLRVADYKTGKKEFSEKDLEKGKNLQLLIYLFTLCKVADKGFFDLCGVESTKDLLPASASYFVVRPPTVDLGELAPGTDVRTAAKDELSRKGFLFSADVLGTAMDKSLGKRFTKALKVKDTAQTEALFETVCTAVANTAQSMRDGKIDASETPVTGTGSPCLYCLYRDVCRKTGKEGENA